MASEYSAISIKRAAKDFRKIEVGTFTLKCEAKIVTTTAAIAIATGIDQRISCQMEWCAMKAVKQFKAIMRSDVPAALFCGVL